MDYLKAAIPNLLITNLEQSKYLTVMTWQRMQDLIKASGNDSVAVADIGKDQVLNCADWTASKRS